MVRFICSIASIPFNTFVRIVMNPLKGTQPTLKSPGKGLVELANIKAEPSFELIGLHERTKRRLHWLIWTRKTVLISDTLMSNVPKG